MATVDESADRLTALVDNLLDMSRLQSGAVTPVSAAADLTDVVHSALVWLDAPQRARIEVDAPDDLPPVLADGADADVTVINPNTTWKVDVNRFSGKSRNCPFDGWRLKGRAVATIVRGDIKWRLTE